MKVKVLQLAIFLLFCLAGTYSYSQLSDTARKDSSAFVREIIERFIKANPRASMNDISKKMAEVECPNGILSIQTRWAGIPDMDTLTPAMMRKVRKLASMDTAYQVTAFNLGTNVLNKHGIVWYEVRCPGDSLSPSADSIVSLLKPGYTLFIDNIYVKTKQGVKYCFRPRKYEIR
jgi:hypothetical protein